MGRKIILNEVPDDRGPARQRAAEGQPVEEILAAIKRLYFTTTAATIDRDFDRAIGLLKSMPTPEDRQRATVYMEGLAEMRKDWKRKRGV